MPEIRVLDENLINKIAAGEVVERPASVVKELCENSLDAGARRISVEISDGGIGLIKISDDGCGIPSDQAETAFVSHATSKLTDFDGLSAIMTMGFRGEALSSIAAVSMTELITKTAEQETAVKISVHGGVVRSVTETAATVGTVITVRDLFYNTPARRKFLKKPGTEGALAAEAVTKLAFGRPDAAFSFTNNGSEVFSTPSGELRTAALSILGRDAASKLLDVSYERGRIKVTGLTGRPELSRGNRSHGYFYINNRYIKSPIAQSAVEAAYKTRLMTGKFPVYILNMEIPPELVDINVHPAKLEARFSQEVDAYRIMLGAVESTIRPVFLVPKAGLYKEEEPEVPAPVLRESYKPPEFIPDFAKKNMDLEKEIEISVGDTKTAEYDSNSIKQAIPDLQYIYIPSEPLSSPLEKEREFKIVGQFFGTYWLIESKEEGTCYLMDQHAAHERVLFEEITESLGKTGAAGQRLIEPIAVKLTPIEKQAVDDNQKLLGDMGFEIEDMYDNNIALRAVPYIFDRPADGGFFMDIIGKLCEEDKTNSVYDAKLENICGMACRAAVKANDHLSEKEARVLVERVLMSDNPFTCPHGRPVLIELTKRDIEKMFKRIL